jgi:hypothetical protein
MEHLPEEGFLCDRCSSNFKDLDELVRHKQLHEASGMDDKIPRPDNPDAKEPGTDHENGFVDPPGAAPIATGARADAQRDASPDLKRKLVDADQSPDEQ